MCYGPLCIKTPRGARGMTIIRSEILRAGFPLANPFNETPQVSNPAHWLARRQIEACKLRLPTPRGGL